MNTQGLKQRVEVNIGQRINQFVTRKCADLHQANLFRIRVEAVGLGIDRDPGSGL